MAESLIIGYGVVLDDGGRVMLLRRRAGESLWPGAVVAAGRRDAARGGAGRHGSSLL